MRNHEAVTDYAVGGFLKKVRPVTADSFPARMPLGKFLFEYLYRRGVRHSFGIPGDFALPKFTWLEKSKIQNITMTHEPAAGFAAGAYSRINGIGLVCVTYCVGGLNVLNAIAGAYAEKSPVAVVSGAPGRRDREKDPLPTTRSKRSRRSAAFTTKSPWRTRCCSTNNAPLRRLCVALKHVCVTNVLFTSRFRTTLLIGKFR